MAKSDLPGWYVKTYRVSRAAYDPSVPVTERLAELWVGMYVTVPPVAVLDTKEVSSEYLCCESKSVYG
jgi:hypothetical protein